MFEEQLELERGGEGGGGELYTEEWKGMLHLLHYTQWSNHTQKINPSTVGNISQ